MQQPVGGKNATFAVCEHVATRNLCVLSPNTDLIVTTKMLCCHLAREKVQEETIFEIAKSASGNRRDEIVAL